MLVVCEGGILKEQGCLGVASVGGVLWGYVVVAEKGAGLVCLRVALGLRVALHGDHHFHK